MQTEEHGAEGERISGDSGRRRFRANSLPEVLLSAGKSFAGFGAPVVDPEQREEVSMVSFLFCFFLYYIIYPNTHSFQLSFNSILSC